MMLSADEKTIDTIQDAAMTELLLIDDDLCSRTEDKPIAPRGLYLNGIFCSGRYVFAFLHRRSKCRSLVSTFDLFDETDSSRPKNIFEAARNVNIREYKREQGCYIDSAIIKQKQSEGYSQYDLVNLNFPERIPVPDDKNADQRLMYELANEVQKDTPEFHREIIEHIIALCGGAAVFFNCVFFAKFYSQAARGIVLPCRLDFDWTSRGKLGQIVEVRDVLEQSL